MVKGRRVAAVGAVLVVSAVLIPEAAAGARPSADGSGSGRTMRFDVEFSPPNYTDFGPTGFSAPDVIVFRDTLLRDGEPVGHEVGSCVLVDTAGTANCTGVVTLDGRGTIAFAFENAPPPEKTLAVTGGTGEFRSAGGEGTLVEAGNGTGTLTLSVHRR
jgi:hypothetical protein